MNARRSFLASTALLMALCAGASVARELRVEIPGEQLSGPARGILSVDVRDIQTGMPLIGAAGALYTISLQGEAPTLLCTAQSGRTGVLTMRSPGKRGDAFLLTVNAPNYEPVNQIVFVGSAPSTRIEAILSPIVISGGGKTPAGAPGQVPTTWGAIKSLY